MTAKTPSQLLTSFENGDVPVQGDYQDVFDSYINVAQTTAQSMASDLSLPNITPQTVSAGTLNGQVAAVSAVNATIVNATTVSASAINAAIGTFGVVSAQAVNASAGAFVTVAASAGVFNSVTAQSVVASAGNFTVLQRSVDSSVRAAGSTQGSAKALAIELSRVVFASADSNNGVILSQITGRGQMVFNDTNINVKVYPAVGGAIDDLGTNNPYVVSASAAIGFYYFGSNIYLSK